MEKISIIFFIFVPSFVHGQIDAACGKQEARFDGYGYYFETVCDKMNRDDASKYCTTRGGWLAEINEDMVDQIADLNETVYFYNGLIKRDDNWEWEKEGGAATNVKWASGEPNGATGGSGLCAALDSRLQSYEWNCSKEQSFMCQFKICAGSGNCHYSVEDCKQSTVPLEDGTTFESYCECKPGYYDEDCAEQYCNPACGKGGICSVKGSDYECTCLPGYYGKNCTEDYCTAYTTTCPEGQHCESTLGEAGYSCACPIGYNGANCSERMYENPTISNLTAEQCSDDGIIHVEWSTSPSAPNEIHRLQVIRVTTGIWESAAYLTPSDSDIRYYTFDGLSSSTEYCLKIQVCPTYECSDYGVNDTVTTGPGIPPDGLYPMVTQSQPDGMCTVTWTVTSPEYTGDVLYLEIAKNDSFIKQPPTSYVFDITTRYRVSPDTSSYSILPSPNRQYIFNISRTSCAGDSEVETAYGKCYAGNAPPYVVFPGYVTVSEPSTTRNFTLQISDESNGPIDCLYLIMTIGALDVKKVQNFQMSDLQSLSLAAKSKPRQGIEYLALAFKRHDTDDFFFRATLGNSKSSGCDVSGTSSEKSSSTYYEGQNWPLEIDRMYSYYVVVSTINRGVVAFGTSDVETFQNGDIISDNEDNLWIIGVVIAALAIPAAIFVTIYLVKKHKRRSQLKDKANTGHSSGYDNAGDVMDGKSC